MKELKKNYRSDYEQLKNLKTEVFYNSQSIDTLKQQLVSAFEDWYANTFDHEPEELATTYQKTIIKPANNKKLQDSIGKRSYIETGDDDGAQHQNNQEDDDGVGIDPDALAFINAKKKVNDLHTAKKQEKKGGGAH